MPAEGERPLFAAGEKVRVIRRFPIGIYRVRVTSAASEPSSNGSSSRQLSITKRKGLWPGYSGATDSLRIEVFETWLERA